MDNFTPLRTKKKKKVNKFLILGNLLLVIIIAIVGAFYYNNILVTTKQKANQSPPECTGSMKNCSCGKSEHGYAGTNSYRNECECNDNGAGGRFCVASIDYTASREGGGLDGCPPGQQFGPWVATAQCLANGEFDGVTKTQGACCNEKCGYRPNCNRKSGDCEETCSCTAWSANVRSCEPICDVNAWSGWSACSANCGGGTQSRSNACGSTETTACNTQACVTYVAATATPIIINSPTPTRTPTPTATPVISNTPTVTPLISNTPTVTPLISNTPGPSATPIPVLCGTKSCDNATNPCRANYVCVQANDGSNYCSSPDFVTACKANPSYNACCIAPGQPTATPTEIILAKISTSPTTVVKLLQTGVVKSFMYFIPAAIILLGLIL